VRNRLIAYLIGSAFAVLFLATVSKRLLRYDDANSVMLFAIVVGVLNTFVLPVVRTLTLPLSCLTLGFFTLALNALVFAVGALLSVGVTISFWGAVFGAIVTSIASGAIYSIIDERPTV
jgi:putative membrane protein